MKRNLASESNALALYNDRIAPHLVLLQQVNVPLYVPENTTNIIPCFLSCQQRFVLTEECQARFLMADRIT
jgi:hypothetical protein